jgi:hypothetical protein
MPTYNSTKEFFAQQKLNFKLASDKNYLLRAAAVESVSLIQDRVQQQGAKSSGQQIGKYNDFAKFRGARRKAKSFASKKRYSKTTSKMTYKQLRQTLGLQVNYIDLTFSGDMFRDWGAFPISDGWANYFKSKKQRKKSQELEARFGQIFFPTKSELVILFRYINRQAINALKR